MKTILASFLVLISITLFIFLKYGSEQKISGAPPYGIDEEEVPQLNPLSYLRNWVRPNGPAKVGIQVGHWKNDELPEELSRLKGNTGSSGGGKSEWEVNLKIANLIADNLKEKGVHVDVLPTTIPQKYWADVFIAIHADGNENSRVSGYKFAGPWRDFTGKADTLVNLLDTTYASQTGLIKDTNISRNMRGYYAFSWWRFDHAIHPMTTAVIAETGFLTSPNDRKIIVDKPEISAKAISDGILNYLSGEKLL